jgi:Uma2 family endonuclease
MPVEIAKDAIHRLLMAADDVGVKLEIAAGMPTWEALPVVRHQRAVKRITASISLRPTSGSGCGCVEYSDVAIRFADGSFKRPDIAIWCREPDEEDEAVTLIPEAVIEVISPGYEKKDTEIGAPFYISAGVKDVILFNPQNGEVEHRRIDGARKLTSPAPIALECGCACTV